MNISERYFQGPIIGQGQFVTVYSCYDKQTRKNLAARCISKSKILECPCKSRLLFNEKILTQLLIHKNIINIIDQYETSQNIVQITKSYSGRNLLTMLQSNIFSEHLKLNVAYELLNAIDYLHSNYIAHRDLKLENILLTKNNHVKLIDFGLSSLSISGIVHDSCGSYPYLSPEVLSGEQYNARQADMWSYGVILYEIFTRKLPYPQVFPGFDFPQPDMSGLSPPISNLILNLLNKDPNARLTSKTALQSSAFRIFRIEPKIPFQFSLPSISPTLVESTPALLQSQSSSPTIETISQDDLSYGIISPSQHIIEKIAKIFNTTIDDVKEQLQMTYVTVPKLLYKLISNKLKKINSKSQNNFSPKFDEAYRFKLPKSRIESFQHPFPYFQSPHLNVLKNSP